jgi:diguanylate cyclase (GGDEF)-like protein
MMFDTAQMQYRDPLGARMSGNTTEAPRRAVETLPECNARLLRKVAQLESEAARARYLAYHDSLTGLPNRVLLFDRLDQAMLQATRQHKTVGLLLLDVDRFKAVNDHFGHNGGDLLLQQVAARLLHCIRGCDTACRYGGDEFVIMLPETRGPDEVQVVQEKLRAHLSEPFRLGDHLVAIGVSIGAAIFMGGAMSCVELIGAADSAMYRAKADRDGRCQYASSRNRECQDQQYTSQHCA